MSPENEPRNSCTLPIGGEFELTPADYAGPPRGDAPTLGRPHGLWTDSGRSALLLALEEITRRGGRKLAWVPAYCCHSVLLPFQACGFTVRFYGQGATLDGEPRFAGTPDADDTFLYIHYFGRRNLAAETWCSEQRRRSPLHVIEDCVQAGLNSATGGFGDFAFTSMRKFVPQPDGALLAADAPIEADLADPDEAFVSGKTIGKLLRGAGFHDSSLSLLTTAEERIDRAVRPARLSLIASHLMARTDFAAAASKRRANFSALMNELRSSGLSPRFLVPLIGEIAPSEVPLGMPVVVADGRRDAVRAFLAAHAIYCPVHWVVDHLGSEPAWRDEIALSRSILTIPIDQRMGCAEIAFVVKTLNAFFQR
jgi:hypothetical protein